MKLHLIDQTVVEITRLTCANYIPDDYGQDECNWNINPVQIVNDKRSGFFAVGEWGCDGYRDGCGKYIRTIKNFKELIPVDSVVKITDIGVW